MVKQVELTTTGRRSGSSHTVILYGFPEEDGVVVVGSAGGSDHDPDWVVNLRRDRSCVLRLGGKTSDVTAIELSGVRREDSWRHVTGRFPLYLDYQQRSERRIPLFLLTDQPDVGR